jgi:hypothetical protein
MKNFMKASVIALSVVLAATAVAAVSAPHTVSAKKKKKVKKIDAEAFKKLTAALNKARAEVKKQQTSLVNKLKESQTDLQKQLKDAIAQASAQKPVDPNAPASNPPAAGGTDPAASTAPTVPAAPAAPAAGTDPAASAAPTDPATPAGPTPPADGTTPDAGTSSLEVDKAFLETLQKLADGDESFSTLFSAKELDKLSSLADRWLSIDKQLVKVAEVGAKLDASYEEAVKSNNYAAALQVQTQQVELDKQVNKAYGSMLTVEHLVSVATNQAVAPDTEDKEDKDKNDKKHNEHKDKKEHQDNKHGQHGDGQNDDDQHGGDQQND